MNTPRTDAKASKTIEEFGPNNGQRFAAMCDFARKLENENSRLTDFASQFAKCPCCNEDETCIEGCTYQQDCIDTGHEYDYERMVSARAALKNT